MRRAELAQELNRTYVPASLHTVAVDRRVEAAGWTAKPVARGPFVKAMHRVAADVFAATVSEAEANFAALTGANSGAVFGGGS